MLQLRPVQWTNACAVLRPPRPPGYGPTLVGWTLMQYAAADATEAPTTRVL